MKRIPRTYARSRRSQKRRKVVRIISIVVLLALLWFGFGAVKSLFNFEAKQVQSMLLTTDNSSQVQVELEPGTWNSGVTDIKLYETNQVKTGNATAVLTTYDNSTITLDTNTTVQITQSESSETDSVWQIKLLDGRIIITASDDLVASRSIVHSQAVITIPKSTTALIGTETFANLKDASAGITITPTEGEPFIIGEGQEYTIPSEGIYATAEQNYSVRTALSESLLSDEFIAAATNLTPVVTTDEEAVLVLTSPDQNELTTDSTITFTGLVKDSVESIEINGSEVQLVSGEFSQSVSLNTGKNTITVVAYAESGEELLTEQRIVTKENTTIATPRISSPTTNGESFTTSEDVVIISGTTDSSTETITVNDYTLQLYEAGSTEWRYLAQESLGNLVTGSNTFTVVAKTSDGTESAPAKITIVKQAGTSTTVSSGSSVSSANSTSSSSQSSTSDSGVYNLSITGPTSTGQFSTSEPEILLEGLNSTNVQSVRVNGYTLQLFEPAKGFWNYKASAELGTMEEGSNLYTVEALNSAGTVVAVQTFTITYTPAAE